MDAYVYSHTLLVEALATFSEATSLSVCGMSENLICRATCIHTYVFLTPYIEPYIHRLSDTLHTQTF